MEIFKAYDLWAKDYDSNINKTRDLESFVLQKTLESFQFDTCLEIGCGTGKNTTWLLDKCKKIIAVDFSDEMLQKAKEKIQDSRVEFVKEDIIKSWDFVANKTFQLATFSLVLEHISDLNSIFKKLNTAIEPNGLVYIGELHPFKQYTGSKARFEGEDGATILTCFTHHISEFTQAAKENSFALESIEEYFDDVDRSSIPRILCLVFRKL